MALVAEGLSNSAISAQLSVAGRTVQTHMRTIFQKPGLLEADDTHRRVLAGPTLAKVIGHRPARWMGKGSRRDHRSSRQDAWMSLSGWGSIRPATYGSCWAR